MHIHCEDPSGGGCYNVGSASALAVVPPKIGLLASLGLPLRIRCSQDICLYMCSTVVTVVNSEFTLCYFHRCEALRTLGPCHVFFSRLSIIS